MKDRYPEWLTIQDIANDTGMNRITVTKYLHELKGEGVISWKIAGKAQLCYLTEGVNKKLKKGVK